MNRDVERAWEGLGRGRNMIKINGMEKKMSGEENAWLSS